MCCKLSRFNVRVLEMLRSPLPGFITISSIELLDDHCSLTDLTSQRYVSTFNYECKT